MINNGGYPMSELYTLTEEEKNTVLKNYFKGNDKKLLTTFPKQAKKKFIILQYIITFFEADREYTEKEVNEILRNIYEDYATLRRALADYGFLDRHRDCSSYWVKQ
jgi:hypothetical protein